MEGKDLVIGQKYYLDALKLETGTYVGKHPETDGIYFRPTGKTRFSKNPAKDEFKG